CEVQGKKAANQIAHAIQTANQRQECNVLILARGGGSLEDLWPFNEEAVARTIFASKLPIVSAVGHETDVTIADFVADQRAATPTAAAELVSPDQNEYQQRYSQHYKQLSQAMRTRQQQFTHRLEKLTLKLQHPSTYLRETAQTLDYYAQQLRQNYKHCLQTKSNQANTLAIKIKQFSPQHQITQYKQSLHWLTQNLAKVIQQQLQQVKQQIGHHASALETLSPLATLARGYSIVNNKEGVIIRNSKQLQIDESVQVHLHKGEVICKVMEK
ncbi:MAG: exodeoxyribonuclease VII large subunit, partial [Gammaproteobacteria bacterium]